MPLDGVRVQSAKIVGSVWSGNLIEPGARGSHRLSRGRRRLAAQRAIRHASFI